MRKRAEPVARVAEEVRALCGSYADLLDSLTAAAGDMDGPERLAAVERALAAVVAFVQSDATAFASGAARPLIALARALHDVKAGAKPELFAVDTAHNRPAGDAFGMARGQAAAAVVILEDAGLQPGEASAFVAAEMARNGIMQPGGKAIDGPRVRRWRDDLRNPDGNKVPAPMRQAFRAAVAAELHRQERDGTGDAGMADTVAKAKARAGALVAVLAIWFPPPGKGAC